MVYITPEKSGYTEMSKSSDNDFKVLSYLI